MKRTIADAVASDRQSLAVGAMLREEQRRIASEAESTEPRWAVGKHIWELAGVVDGLPRYRAAMTAVLVALEPMVAGDGWGYLRPETLRSVATRYGLATSEKWDALLQLMFAEGHLWPNDFYFIGPSPGPSSCAWRVRSLQRRPFDPGAPYPARPDETREADEGEA